ncbi:MAG: PDZ domain-containing protein, partial [Lachnospiraceae bacterium]|nr:PDZ domain-containing protein [Lachnospiraceae bacterium]
MPRNTHGQIIKEVLPDSAACDAGIRAGDELLALNGNPVGDIFDYQYECADTEVEITVRHADGSRDTYLIEKTEDEDPGLVFEDGIMDEYRRCHNKCIFCFIDQMPGGMRDTLYFKDDDSRLSFLQGNYVTLTNMSDDDINKAVREAQEYEAQDKKRKEGIDARNDADSFVFQTEKALQD